VGTKGGGGPSPCSAEAGCGVTCGGGDFTGANMDQVLFSQGLTHFHYQDNGNTKVLSQTK